MSTQETSRGVTRSQRVTIATLDELSRERVPLNGAAARPDVTERVGQLDGKMKHPGEAWRPTTRDGSTLEQEDWLPLNRIADNHQTPPTQRELLQRNNTALSLIEHQPWTKDLIGEIWLALTGSSLEALMRHRQAG